MAEWVSDNMYILFEDGDLAAPVEIQANWKKLVIDGKINPIETTRGPLKTHADYVPGMSDYEMKLTMGVDDTDIMPLHFKPRKIYTITVGVNGNGSGEPMHKQLGFVTTMPVEVASGLGERVREITIRTTGNPINDMFDGAVFP